MFFILELNWEIIDFIMSFEYKVSSNSANLLYHYLFIFLLGI